MQSFFFLLAPDQVDTVYIFKYEIFERIYKVTKAFRWQTEYLRTKKAFIVPQQEIFWNFGKITGKMKAHRFT